MVKYDSPQVVSDTEGTRIEWIPTPQEAITRQVAKRIAYDRERKFIQALVDLGWTPPPGTPLPLGIDTWEARHGWDEHG